MKSYLFVMSLCLRISSSKVASALRVAQVGWRRFSVAQRVISDLLVDEVDHRNLDYQQKPSYSRFRTAIPVLSRSLSMLRWLCSSVGDCYPLHSVSQVSPCGPISSRILRQLR